MKTRGMLLALLALVVVGAVWKGGAVNRLMHADHEWREQELGAIVVQTPVRLRTKTTEGVLAMHRGEVGAEVYTLTFFPGQSEGDVAEDLTGLVTEDAEMLYDESDGFLAKQKDGSYVYGRFLDMPGGVVFGEFRVEALLFQRPDADDVEAAQANFDRVMDSIESS